MWPIRRSPPCPLAVNVLAVTSPNVSPPRVARLASVARRLTLPPSALVTWVRVMLPLACRSLVPTTDKVLAWSMLLLLCRVRSPVILLVPRCSLSPVTLTFFPVSASAPPKVLPIDSRLALPLPAFTVVPLLAAMLPAVWVMLALAERSSNTSRAVTSPAKTTPSRPYRTTWPPDSACWVDSWPPLASRARVPLPASTALFKVRLPPLSTRMLPLLLLRSWSTASVLLALNRTLRPLSETPPAKVLKAFISWISLTAVKLLLPSTVNAPRWVIFPPLVSCRLSRACALARSRLPVLVTVTLSPCRERPPLNWLPALARVMSPSDWKLAGPPAWNAPAWTRLPVDANDNAPLVVTVPDNASVPASTAREASGVLPPMWPATFTAAAVMSSACPPSMLPPKTTLCPLTATSPASSTGRLNCAASATVTSPASVVVPLPSTVSMLAWTSLSKRVPVAPPTRRSQPPPEIMLPNRTLPVVLVTTVLAPSSSISLNTMPPTLRNWVPIRVLPGRSLLKDNSGV